MKKINGFTLFLILILFSVLILPLIVPLPPLTGIQPVEELTYSDSQFKEIDGINIHYQQIGENSDTLIILLHGFGSSTYSWQKVMDPLSEYGAVLAYDRPAFGLTERVTTFEDKDFNPYKMNYQPEIVINFIDEEQAEKVILIGNSAGGTVAIQTALDYPDKISALILVSPAVFESGGAPGWIKPLLNLPHFNRLGPILVRSIRERGLELLELAWSDQQKITQKDYENYQKPLSVSNWDTALWEFTKVNGGTDLQSRLKELSIPVLIISGEYDKIIPVEQSKQLAVNLPGSEIVIIPNCGHVPQEECPDGFLEATDSFINSIVQ